MLTRLGLLVAVLLLLPGSSSGQETDAPLAQGDSVRFSLDLEEGPATWTGVVREVKNPRDCVFVLVRSYDSEVFSLGVKFTDSFEIERLNPTPTVLTAAALRSQGISCVEAHVREDPIYLNPKADADSKEGA